METADQVLRKYKNHPVTEVSGTLLPKKTNEKANLYLNAIGREVGIEKNLTFHMARHTFATTVALGNGMPIETVSKILGHSKITTTQIYARVMDNKLKSDMDSVQRRLHEKYRKVEEERELEQLINKIIEMDRRRYAELSRKELMDRLKNSLRETSR